MDPLSREYLSDYYSKLLHLHGDRPEALRWSPKGQVARYDALCRLSPDINGSSVIDYGCGKGDLYDYMLNRGLSTMYTGIDITPELIELAGRKHPDCGFMVHDIEDGPLGGEYDFGFICGVFNNKIEGATESLYNCTGLLFEHIKVGMAVNALSAHTLNKSFELNYIDPDHLLRYAKAEITSNAELRLDLVDGDVFLYLYR